MAPSIVLRANSMTDVDVRYRPLLVGSSTAQLRLECAELGVYDWQLQLLGVQTNPERTLTFNVPLGSRETQVWGGRRGGRRELVCVWGGGGGVS